MMISITAKSLHVDSHLIKHSQDTGVVVTHVNILDAPTKKVEIKNNDHVSQASAIMSRKNVKLHGQDGLELKMPISKPMVILNCLLKVIFI